ncbi:conjugative transfer ATPase [Mergibacter septicus]|uniref:Conjugative transfer ATPase n=1 Tax=Mergibacter septicus TaxID=221402 RepID=A0A8D4LJB4_9PAST|nr:conjugative transfer ATPase [Mergibacter septicus]AWX14720.1 conjugative transfer ATPase [Mergibacter septicus]QDJ13971.1 conjugative transfer ATPase [Mergibacter septicus]UTU48579.1 conjugative transfer ATPase [Mergibacter septicus]
MFSFFKRNQDVETTETVQSQYGHASKSPVSLAEHKKMYAQCPSFVSHLPYVEFLDTEKAILLDDGYSVGAVFDVKPLGTEGRSLEYLESVRSQIKDALQDSFDELDTNPWVVQFFCQDDDVATEYRRTLENYIQPNAKGSQFTEAWLNLMGKHLRDIASPNGLFIDKKITNTPWRGQLRRTRMVIYRYANRKTDTESPLEMLNNICERVVNSLNAAGISLTRLAGYDVHQWLLKWFNPAPKFCNSPNEFYEHLAYRDPSTFNNDELMIWDDFAETMLINSPLTKGDYWYFDDKPHEVVVVDGMRKPPAVGILTGEIKRGDNTNTLFDLLPAGTIMSMTMVVYPQDLLEQHLLNIASKAKGDNVESRYAKQDCDTVQEYLRDKHKLYRSSLCFYINGDDEKDLKSRSRKLRSILLSNGLVPINEGNEVAPLNSYLRWLPMCFRPDDDRKHLYTKFNFVQHIANLLPVFGRSTGTGHPGISFFNRGGAPLDYDPLSKKDRTKNAHLLMLGPTGAGKSATLNGKIAQLVAVHRPRLFIIEAGNSFGLMADYAESLGVSVNKVTLKPGSGVTLPLFADSHKLIEEINITQRLDERAIEIEEEREAVLQDDESDDQRDILGEMELTATLMITGGEVKEYEKLNRTDKAMIRRAIMLAAEKTYSEKRQCLTADVRDALYELSRDDSLPDKRRERAYDMGESLGMFCQAGSFENELFNQEGQAWPDADITLVDLATFAREGYESQLAIAYISLINHINSLGEKYQYAGRPLVNITDEAHNITRNPLLAKYLTKGSKMWRKLGIWLWLATQNMGDFPNESAKIIGMLEWWELLCGVDDNELKEICRFKPLTEEQKSLIRSAQKEDRKYTEGVVLSNNIEALFRVVPPSLFLALAMTEPEEKAERMRLMKEHNVSELEAAYLVAKSLDKARGIDS